MPLSTDVVEWIAGERRAVSRSDVLIDIVRFSKSSKLWPAASYEEWDAAINEAIRDGRIVESNGKLLLAPPLEVEQKPKQLGLF